MDSMAVRPAAVSADFKEVLVGPAADREVRAASVVPGAAEEAEEDAVVAEAAAALEANFKVAPDEGLSMATSRASGIDAGRNPPTTDR